MKKPKKGIIIIGTARSPSNTLNSVLKITKFKNFESLELNKHALHHYNYNNPPNDDFLIIIKKILQYDVIVFATPVYWYSMSGHLKVFFDRLTELITTSKDLGRKLAGKDVYLFANGSEKKLPKGFEVPFKKTSLYFNMNFKKSIYKCTKTGKEV